MKLPERYQELPLVLLAMVCALVSLAIGLHLISNLLSVSAPGWSIAALALLYLNNERVRRRALEATMREILADTAKVRKELERLVNQ